MTFVVREEEDGRHFAVLAPGNEVVGICATRRAAEDLAEAMRAGCEEAMQSAVAYTRMRHGRAIIEPR